MKVLDIFVSNDLATDQRIIRISTWLVCHGWTVRVTGIRHPESLSLAMQPYSMQRVNIWPRTGIFFYAVVNIVFFIKAFSSSSPVLMAVDLDTLPAIRLAAWFSRKKLVWDCHEIYAAIPELYKKPLVQKFWTWIERLFLPGIDQVMTVTTGVSEHLRRFGLQPTIIHNYPLYRNHNISAVENFDSKLILFQGHLNEGRCLDVLILSLKSLPATFTLQIAGDGHLKNQLISLTKGAGLQDRVQFLGMLPPEKLNAVTQKAFVGISLLEKRHENSRVSLANKNLDYIMAGLPCITMDFPEYRAINDQWPVALLLQEDVSSEILAQEIENLSLDFEKYMDLHQACLHAKTMLNWEHESDKLAAVFGRFTD